MAMENPNVTGDVVEASEFPEVARRYQVMAVPKTVVNDKVEFMGAVPEAMFLDQVLRAVGNGNGPGAAPPPASPLTPLR